MAYTVSNVTTRALKRLYAVTGGDTPSAEDAATALDVYNAFMFGLEASGLTLTDSGGVTYTHADQTGVDSFPIADKFYEGVVALVAVKMAPEFEVEPSAVLAFDASEGMSRLYGAFLVIEEVAFDTGVTQVPSLTDKWWPG